MGCSCSQTAPMWAPFHGIQPFRNRVLQCGYPTGPQILPANLPQRVSHGDTAFFRNAPAQCGLLQGLQGNLCSTAWSSSCPYFCTSLGSAGLFLLYSHPSLFQLQLLQSRNFGPHQPRCAATVTARLSCIQSSSLLEPWLCQMWGNLPAASHRALYPPTTKTWPCTQDQGDKQPHQQHSKSQTELPGSGSQSCATLSPHHLEASGQRHKVCPWQLQPAEGLDVFASCKCALFLT